MFFVPLLLIPVGAAFLSPLLGVTVGGICAATYAAISLVRSRSVEPLATLLVFLSPLFGIIAGALLTAFGPGF